MRVCLSPACHKRGASHCGTGRFSDSSSREALATIRESLGIISGFSEPTPSTGIPTGPRWH